MLFRPGWRLAEGKRFSRVPGWMGGLVYGILLWVLAQTVILPGTDSPMRFIPLGLFAAAHAVYGLALGTFSGRMRL